MRKNQWVGALARCRWLVIAAWLVAVIGSAVAYPMLRDRLSAPDYTVDGAESSRARSVMNREFPELGTERDVIVFSADGLTVDEPAYRATISAVVDEVRKRPYVTGVVAPSGQDASRLVSADRTAALTMLGITGNESERIERATQIQDVVQSTTENSTGGVQAWLTGYSAIAHDLTVVEERDATRAEYIALPIALVVLLLTLGTIVASLLPLALAGAGLLTTFGVLTALAGWLNISVFVVAFVTLIGLGIGIDYSMFIVSRFREELARRGGRSARRGDVTDAVAAAMASSGRTIAVSGVVVAVSLCSLLVVNSPAFREIAIGAAAVVVCTLAAAWTLLPALLVTLGPNVLRGALPKRWQPADTRTDAEAASGGWARWANKVMQRPVIAAFAAAAVLLVAAIPVLTMTYGLALGVNTMGNRPTGRAQAVLDEKFSAGVVSPIQVVIPDARHVMPAVDAVVGEIMADRRVSSVQPVPSRDGSAVLLSVVPAVPVDSRDALNLVADLRSSSGPLRGADSLVGGATAEFVDLSTETRQAMIPVVSLVLGISLLFLLAYFRSVVLPVKAVLMNLLATAAALGLLVLVFQHGVGASLIDYTALGYVQVYLPLTVFALLFGLSMDYEVFLVGRMRESWLQTGDNTTAVAAGLAHTARPISAAAAIMVAVFGSFMISAIPELKQTGFALAVAIALDATLIRLVLVPALMRLFGHWNWWLPGRSADATRTYAPSRRQTQ